MWKETPVYKEGSNSIHRGSNPSYPLQYIRGLHSHGKDHISPRPPGTFESMMFRLSRLLGYGLIPWRVGFLRASPFAARKIPGESQNIFTFHLGKLSNGDYTLNHLNPRNWRKRWCTKTASLRRCLIKKHSLKVTELRPGKLMGLKDDPASVFGAIWAYFQGLWLLVLGSVLQK